MGGITQIRPIDCNFFDPEIDETPIDEIVVLVDHPSWAEPKKALLSQLGISSTGVSTHIEADILTGLSSNTVEVDFATAFLEIPIGRKNLYCYRVADGYDSNVIIKDITITITGFSLEIDAEETDLTGIILEYSFQERTV